MDIVAPLLNGIETAFQKHEKEVVIELAIDRLLDYIGVYLIVALALLSKASEILANDNIACYVTNNTHKLDRGFMLHAKQFCWESMGNSDPNFIDKCTSNPYEGQKDHLRQERLLDEPTAVKNFARWMPYFFLAEVVLFSIPSLWWHTIVGARLTGHLKFSLSFLKDVYEALKIIPAGLYRKLPYDKEGIYLNGWRQFRHEYKAEQLQGMSRNTSGGFKKQEQPPSPRIFEKALSEVKLHEVIEATSKGELQDGDAEVEAEKKKSDGQSSDWKFVKMLCGSVKDRHLFSMLCFENFASLEYHPYIMSVYALTSTKSAENDYKGIVPLKQGILRQFYNKENFTGNFLVKCYAIRYLYGITVSLVALITCWAVFGYFLYPAFTTKTFQCSIPFHSLCLVCTLKNHWDMTALFLVNIGIVVVYFGLSVYQFYFVRFGSHRALCHYFEDMGDNFSVALRSAHTAEQRKRK